MPTGPFPAGRAAEPRVSVVVPAYNCDRYLEACLKSILSQQVQLEVVCVDDGSTDRTGALLDRIARWDGRVSVVHQENQGAGAARNRGLAACHGDYVCFVDADDVLRPGALWRLAGLAGAQTLDVLYYDADVLLEDESNESLRDRYEGEVHYFHRDRPHAEPCSGRELLVDFCERGGYCVSPALQLLNRGFLERDGLRFPEGVPYEDNLFFVKTAFAAGRVAHVNERWYVRRLHAASVTTSGASPEAFRGNVRALLDIFAFACEQDLTVREASAIDSQLGFLRATCIEQRDELVARGIDPESVLEPREVLGARELLR